MPYLAEPCPAPASEDTLTSIPQHTRLRIPRAIIKPPGRSSSKVNTVHRGCADLRGFDPTRGYPNFCPLWFYPTPPVVNVCMSRHKKQPKNNVGRQAPPVLSSFQFSLEPSAAPIHNEVIRFSCAHHTRATSCHIIF